MPPFFKDRRLVNFDDWSNLGACAKFQKATRSFVMPVLSVRQSHGTTLLPPDGFLWNFVFEDFSKFCRGNSSLIKTGQEWRVLYVRTNILFFIISRSFLLRMRKVSDKSVKKMKTHILCSVTPPPRKSCRPWGNVEKCCRAGQATDDSMADAHCMLDT